MSFIASGLLYTGQIHSLRSSIQNNNEARMSLANRPQFSGSLSSQDTHLTMQSQAHGFMATALEFMRDSLRKQVKQNIKSSFNTFA